MACLITTAAGEPRRTVSTRDAVEMRVPAAWEEWSSNGDRPRVEWISPDGSRFIVILKRGDVASNTNRYTMLCWAVADLTAGRAAPQVVLEMSSSANAGTLNQAEWDDDNETVWFVGEDNEKRQQLFTVNVRTRELRQLTHHPTDVLAYGRDARGRKVAYLALRPARDLWNEETRRDGLVALDYPALMLPELILGKEDAGALFDRKEVATAEAFLADADGTRPLAFTSAFPVAFNVAYYNGVSISPDGSQVVAAVQIPYDRIPVSWREYADFPRGAWPKRYLTLTSYEIHDVRTGQSRRVLDAPARMVSTSHGLRQSPVWLPDSRSVVLSASFLPLEGVDVAERQRRTSETATVEVDVPSGNLRRIGADCLLAVRWDAKKQELVCVADTAGQLARFRKAAGQWQRVRHPASRNGIEISLREDLNTPPRIYWRRAGDREPRLLLDLNPQFEELRYGKVEALNWEWKPGRRVSGSLYYPPGFQSGRRYPLVLQTRGRYPLEKAPDGRAPSHFEMEGLTAVGYGGQALAARDILVLQLDDWAAVANDDSRQEMTDAMLLYRQLVAHFVERGLVDATRVGILGWSHSCGYVAWALTHEPSLFAAAAVSGESTGGYLSLMSRVDGGAGSDIGKLYGGEPLGSHLQAWVDLAPSFNLDRVQAPIRLAVLSAPLYLSAQWEWFEGLTRLGKPADLILFQNATHILRRPAERMAISGGNVDWFDFWLNGHEDPATEKTAQYTRWRKLRELAAKSP